MVSQEGFEPSTLALKGRYSTTELLAREFATFLSTQSFVKYFRLFHQISRPLFQSSKKNKFDNLVMIFKNQFKTGGQPKTGG